MRSRWARVTSTEENSPDSNPAASSRALKFVSSAISFLPEDLRDEELVIGGCRRRGQGLLAGQRRAHDVGAHDVRQRDGVAGRWHIVTGDRKSTRLNSSHVSISYAVRCLKKKTQ